MTDLSSFVGADWLRVGFKPVLRIVRTVCSPLAAAYDRYRQRQALMELDDHHLADLGLSRADVRRECAKSWGLVQRRSRS